jgi:hypothetical protein
VLLGQGVVIADGSPEEVLGGGRHFSTEVARVTNGAALLPEDGARRLREGDPDPGGSRGQGPEESRAGERADETRAGERAEVRQ